MKQLHTLAIALIAVFALAACGNDEQSTGAGGPEDHDEHDHAAQHGGMLVETSGHDMHFEVKHDETAGLVQVWVYDGAMKPVTSEAPIIQLAEDSGGHKITGMDPKGAKKAHEWHFSHKALEGHVHGRLRLSHAGKSYNVDLPEDEHAHDDHEGHEHDKDHDHDHDHDHDDKKKDKDHDHEHDDHDHEHKDGGK